MARTLRKSFSCVEGAVVRFSNRNLTSLLTSGARRKQESRRRWKANSFSGTSYVISSIITWIMSARQIRAPRIAVRGTNSSTPPAASAKPVKIS